MTNSLHQIPLDAEIFSRTPAEVLDLIFSLLKRIRVLEARVEELEAKLNQNSSNSNKPPSSDAPFVKWPEAAKKSKKVSQAGEMRQQCLRPTKLIELLPQKCFCGCGTIVEPEPYHIHQVIELSSIEAKVTHIIFYQGHCCTCGEMVKAHIPLAMSICSTQGLFVSSACTGCGKTRWGSWCAH